jgi:hypothetical protein
MSKPNEPPASTGLWRPPLWLGVCWGFAEATLFFIIPDVILSWASLTGAKYGIKIFGAIICGAVAGGIFMYSWASWRPDVARSAVATVPFVRARMFEKVQVDYRTHGVAGIFYTMGTGIPYKVYAALAPSVSSPATFALITIPARLERMALSWVIPAFLGWFLRRWIKSHRGLTATLFAGFWIVTYAIYWSSVGPA